MVSLSALYLIGWAGAGEADSGHFPLLQLLIMSSIVIMAITTSHQIAQK
jgi:hypothetical protein